MKKTIASFIKAFLNLVYPLSCHICKAKISENVGLCEGCLAKIKRNESGIAACRYEGVLKDALHLYKYNGIMSLLNSFSRLISGFIDKSVNINEIDAIVPIPLHSVRHRERGFNQAYSLGHSISKRYKIPLSSGNLIKRKKTQPQSGLNRKERADNLKDAFFVKRPELIQDRRILLVDDVYTTGATIENARNALARSGASSVRVVTLARGI